MKMALNHAGLKPEDIDYLNAHGTSTSVGDINESRAVRELFGEHTDKLVVSSTKGATGHLLGGAGGIESVRANRWRKPSRWQGWDRAGFS